MSSLKDRIFLIVSNGKDTRLQNLLEGFNSYDVEGLEELFDEFRGLKEAGFYGRLCKTADLGRKILVPGLYRKGVRDKSRLITLASDVLSNPPVYSPPRTDLIIFKIFFVIYTFLECVYYMNSGTKLDLNDLNNVYGGGIDERIVFGLENFDKISVVPRFTEEFFIKLKNVKWQDNETRSFYRKLNELRNHFKIEIFGVSYIVFHSRFSTTENVFLLFLAGSSAVNNGREFINKEDLVRAYKAYFKLIRTDITRYMVGVELEQEIDLKSMDKDFHGGHLVCDRCKGYYKLQSGESPEDFSDRCDCGGHFNFQDSLNGNREVNIIKFWVSLILGVFITFFLFSLLSFNFMMIFAPLIGGMVTAYINGGTYRQGAKNGIFTGVGFILVFILVIYLEKILLNSDFFSNVGDNSLEFTITLILLGFLVFLATFLAFLGGLMGVWLKKHKFGSRI